MLIHEWSKLLLQTSHLDVIWYCCKCGLLIICSHFYLYVYPLVAILYIYLFISPIFTNLDSDTWSMVVMALSSSCCSVVWIIGLWSQLVGGWFWSSRLPRCFVSIREFPFKRHSPLADLKRVECLYPVRRLYTRVHLAPLKNENFGVELSKNFSALQII